MFNLKNANGDVLKMKSGEPFIYSSRDLARSAKRLLENEKTGILSIVSA